MGELTDSQKRIASTIDENPDYDIADISDATDLSKSWVRKTLTDHAKQIFGENDLSDMSIEVSFHRPNGIFFDKSILSKFDFSIGDSITLELHDGGTDTVRTFGKAESVSKLDTELEVHNRVYAAQKASEETLEQMFENSRFLSGLPTDEIGLYSPGELFRIYNGINSSLSATKKKIVIGVNYLNRVGQEYEPGPISLPSVGVSSENIQTAFNDGSTILTDVRSLDSDVSIFHPDQVYFIRRSEEIDGGIKNRIVEREIFDFQYHRFLSYDPLLSGPHTPPPKERLLRISNSNLSITPEKSHVIRKTRDKFSREEITNEIQNIALSLENNNISIEPRVSTMNGRTLFQFKFGSMYINLSISENFLSIDHMKNSKISEKISKNLINYVKEKIGTSNTEQSSGTLSFKREFAGDTSVILDTNVLYNNLRDESGESILRLFLENTKLYSLEFIIPWTVLYELNKHKDRGGPGPQVQEQAVENLQLLEMLDRNDLISFDTQDLPNQIESRVADSDVADMNMLQCANRHDRTVLVTGDERLREVAERFNINTKAIKDFIDITPSTDAEEEVRKSVLPEVNSESMNREEIVSRIEETIQENKDRTERPVEGDAEPSQFLEQMQDDGEVIPVVDDECDSLVYTRADTAEVVITPTAVSAICGKIEKVNGKKYISREFLESIKIPGMKSSRLPYLHFYVPLSNAVAPQSASFSGLSRTARELYKLKHINNANYSSEEISEATARGEHVHDAVLLARQKGIPLLYAGDDYLEKVSGLLGVKTVECRNV